MPTESTGRSDDRIPHCRPHPAVGADSEWRPLMYDGPKQSAAEDSVRYRREDLDYFQRNVREAEHDAARTMRQYLLVPVIFSVTSALAAATAGAMILLGALTAEATSDAQLFVCGALIVLMFGAGATHDGYTAKAHAAGDLNRERAELTAAQIRLVDAEETLAGELARAEHLRQLPAVLNDLVAQITFDSRDWSRDDKDCRLYAMIVGWDGDVDDPDDDGGDGAWAEAAEKHGWTPAHVARLKAAHEAFLWSKAHEDARRM